VLGEDPGDVERDVPGAEHGHLARLERPRTRHVRVPVVPGHEVGRAVGLGQVDPGDREGRIPDRAGREDHRVVELAQVLELEVDAVLHVGQQPDVAALEHLVQRDDDLLDPGVVGRDAVAHESEGRRQAFEEVDADVEAGLGQDVGGVDAGGARANHGDAQGSVAAHETVVPSRSGA